MCDVGLSIFSRQCIIHAKSAPNNKQTVGQFMWSSGGVFLEASVHKQRPHFQVKQLLSVALGHLAEIHFPKLITCGFGMAAHSLQGMQSITNITTHISKTFRSMVKDWHESGSSRNDG